MSTKHFNIFNTGESSFFTPGTQLANIAKVKPDAPAIVYINPENKESVMTWHSLEVLSTRIAWYLLEQGIKPGKSVIVALPNIPTHIASCFWNLEGRWMLCTDFSASTPQKYDGNMRMCISITGYHQSLETRRMLKSQFFRTQDDQRRLPGAYAS